MSSAARTSVHDVTAASQIAKQLGVDGHRFQRVRNALLKQQQPVAESLTLLSEQQQRAFAERIEFHPLKLVEQHDSQFDGASKLVFSTATGGLIETVILRISSGRTALCISSQVGCAAKCTFCATGQMGVARNLSYAEILDQVVQANQLLRSEKRRVRNVVFMGMGEPFHNSAEVYPAVEHLCSPSSFNLSPKHVAVSTVGLPDAMVDFAEHFPQGSLALSLHSARQEIRETIIPVARRYPLGEVRRALERVTQIQSRPVMIEYLLLLDVNDRSEDATALADYLAGIPVHINLIPFNATGNTTGLQASPLEQRWEFARMLRAQGYRVTMRYSLGADIDAACGQLVQKVEKRRAVQQIGSLAVAPTE